ncbi:2-hydroxycyclohexanecarboxyl-CoA dehydrogenase [Constrictibacter sp. MBR-5]|jgi:2-hydroxycyclohexanecarboxyl-CoA dehydrogenase|uniref:SDR family NAD(P)-dependent oxidoreductase n=1 Tax=Constrictibacter sp. MBR-5 TaxID=3156467 RepID=UPI003393D337
MIDLKGKTALVTGAASGIGRATAETLAEAGAHVVGADLDEARLSEMVKAVDAAGGSAEGVVMDVTSWDAVNAVAADVNGRYGRMDILVNVAGWDRIEPFMQNDEAFIEKIVSLNYLGQVRVAKAFLPPMIEAQQGMIVNVSSDAGRVGSMGETVYAGAKGGVIAFTKSLAREMARHGICVNCVCPGPTDTPLFAAQPDRMREALLRVIPFRRLGTPQDLANAILFFASPRASYVTGQVLSVSGGLTMSG